MFHFTAGSHVCVIVRIQDTLTDNLDREITYMHTVYQNSKQYTEYNTTGTTQLWATMEFDYLKRLLEKQLPLVLAIFHNAQQMVYKCTSYYCNIMMETV